MIDPQLVATLIIAGMLVSLALAGVLTAQTGFDRIRQQTLFAVALGLALAVAGRIHGHSSLDLWSWVVIAAALIPLWPLPLRPYRKSPAADPQSLTPRA